VKNSLLFIVNPISGTVRKHQIIDKIQTYLRDVPHEIALTEYAGHATQIARQAVANQRNIVVAVGGDGTVNEIARALLHTSVKLGIIPVGSGNGLARHLQLPFDVSKALNIIVKEHTVAIDVGFVNDRPFFCTSGLGFDALISYKFSRASSRGLYNYARITAREYFRYTEKQFYVAYHGKVKEVSALMLTLANASQFGNNTFISPQASLTDGLLDFCLVRRLPIWHLPHLALDNFRQTIHRNPHVQITRTTDVTITALQPNTFAHVDGDFIDLQTNEYHYTIRPLALQVIAKENSSSTY